MTDKFLTSRTRIVLSRILIATLVLYALFNHPPDYFSPFIQELSEMIGFALLAVAAFGRIWCLIYVGGKKNDVLMTLGPYSIVRNPLYVFSFLGAVGLGLTVGNPWLALFLAVVFAAYYPYVVRKEERRLIALFGTEYRDYMARTPRWFPRFGLYREPETITVRPKYVHNSILSAMWFVWAIILWELLEFVHSFWGAYGK
jgi:protein-S-isoprenylcysteine O-methyltransferase Ste14